MRDRPKPVEGDGADSEKADPVYAEPTNPVCPGLMTTGSYPSLANPVSSDTAAPNSASVATAVQKKNVFLIGLNEFNRAKLDTVNNAENYNFYSLLEEPHDYNLPAYLEVADGWLRAFDGPIDAVVGYMDFQ